jgi:hypothetical protein
VSHGRGVSLIDAKWQQIRKEEKQKGQTTIESVRALHQEDLDHPDFIEISQDKIVDHSGVGAFSEQHAVECMGLFTEEGKKANVTELVKGIIRNSAKAGGKMKDPAGMAARAAAAGRRADLAESEARVMQQSKHGADVDDFVGGFEKAGGSYDRSLMQKFLNGWYRCVRKELFERKRANILGTLVWGDNERAKVLVTSMETLARADKLSWFRVDAQHTKPSQLDARSAFPLSAPPVLHGETCDEFGPLQKNSQCN